jgi:hypothetical protein
LRIDKKMRSQLSVLSYLTLHSNLLESANNVLSNSENPHCVVFLFIGSAGDVEKWESLALALSENFPQERHNGAEISGGLDSRLETLSIGRSPLVHRNEVTMRFSTCLYEMKLQRS